MDGGGRFNSTKKLGSDVIKQAEVDSGPAKYAVSDIRPISKLIAHTLAGKEQIKNLQDQGLTHMRHVRGDGNCFYRAVGFRWLEELACGNMSAQERLQQLQSTLLPTELERVLNDRAKTVPEFAPLIKESKGFIGNSAAWIGGGGKAGGSAGGGSASAIVGGRDMEFKGKNDREPGFGSAKDENDRSGANDESSETPKDFSITRNTVTGKSKGTKNRNGKNDGSNCVISPVHSNAVSSTSGPKANGKNPARGNANNNNPNVKDNGSGAKPNAKDANAKDSGNLNLAPNFSRVNFQRKLISNPEMDLFVVWLVRRRIALFIKNNLDLKPYGGDDAGSSGGGNPNGGANSGGNNPGGDSHNPASSKGLGGDRHNTRSRGGDRDRSGLTGDGGNNAGQGMKKGNPMGDGGGKGISGPEKGMLAMTGGSRDHEVILKGEKNHNNNDTNHNRANNFKPSANSSDDGALTLKELIRITVDLSGSDDAIES